MISDKSAYGDLVTDMTSENNQMYMNEIEKKPIKYSCNTCGNTFDANPPDDVHRFSSVYPCWKFDWVERSFQCFKCNKSTKLFWHPKVHNHHDYATLQEIEHKISKNTRGSLPDYAQRMRGY
jgi:rubredoxin